MRIFVGYSDTISDRRLKLGSDRCRLCRYDRTSTETKRLNSFFQHSLRIIQAYALGYYGGKAVDSEQQHFHFNLNHHLYEIFVIVLACVLGIASYYNSLPGIWIYDDWEAIVFNQDVTSIARTGKTLTQRLLAATFSSEFWSHDFWGQPLTSLRSHKSWRPLTILTYRVQAATVLHPEHLLFAPEDAAWFRGVNVILHGICSGVLAFWLSQILKVSNTIALIASVFFAVHPVHTEVINCGVGRAEILSGIFFLVSLCAHARYCREHNSRHNDWSIHKWQILAMLCGFLAMLSKETGITCLGVCAVQDIFLTYCSWQEKKKNSNEESKEKFNFVVSFLKSPFVNDSNEGYILTKLWRRICTLFLTVILFVMIRLHVMGWTTPGDVRAFSQFDNPLAHTKDRTSRVRQKRSN